MSWGVTRNFQLGTPISAFILGVGVNNIEPIWIVVDEVSFTRYAAHDGILFKSGAREIIKFIGNFSLMERKGGFSQKRNFFE